MISPLILIDFDGVIVDSAPECFETTYQTILLLSNEDSLKEYCSIREIPKQKLKSIFLNYRGIVNPPEHFLTLMILVKKLILEKKEFKLSYQEILFEFNRLNKRSDLNFIKFKKYFFQSRKKYFRKINNFISMNEPTEFTNKVIEEFGYNWPFCILSAKNEEIIKLWLDYFNIEVKEILGNKILEKFNYNKYNAVKNIFFADNKERIKGLFIDDYEMNLDPNFSKLGIETYFANWGYGKNINHKVSIDEKEAIIRIKKILT